MALERTTLSALAICFGLSTVPTMEAVRQAESQPLVLGEPRNITARLAPTNATDIAVGPEGSLIVADRGRNVLAKLSVEGDVVWQTGGTGQGPGEFGLLYRADVSSEGEVVALDNRPQQVSWFDAEGNFIRRASPPVRMRVTDSFVLLPDMRIAVSGVASGAPRSGVRVYEFDEQERTLREVAAFGPLPVSRDPGALIYWGAGWLHLAGDGALLYARKLPYEVHKFDVRGEPLEVFAGDYEFTRWPDENVVESRDGDRVVLSLAPDFVARPAGAHDLGGNLILSVVLTDYGGQGVWDVMESGRLLARLPAPPGMAFVTAVDRVNKFIYAPGDTADGASAYFQIPYSIDRAPDRE